MKQRPHILVIGGGFYGAYIAEHFAQKGFKVSLHEKENQLMLRASFNNQARVHNGYHYPRSILTALRSRVSFPRFAEEFKPAIEDSFEKSYLIGSLLGKITGEQFQNFAKRIEAPCTEANADVQSLINHDYIDGAFNVIEYAFDATQIRSMMEARLNTAGVHIETGSTVLSIEQETIQNRSTLKAKVQNQADKLINELSGIQQIFNCTYSGLNYFAKHPSIPLIPLKHELTEICLVEVPPELKNKGITVMCGPFFSLMPFPSTPYHSFSHVRYTPHYEWTEDVSNASEPHPDIQKHTPRSNWKKMQIDASKYIPLIKECTYKKSLWEIKTVLPSSENNDSRPILFKENHGLTGYHCVMGAKIDNIYDALALISSKQLDTLPESEYEQRKKSGTN